LCGLKTVSDLLENKNCLFGKKSILFGKKVNLFGKKNSNHFTMGFTIFNKNEYH